MPTGYVRQDTTGQLADGNPIDADLFNDEYNAIVNAFNASTGHNHDGTTGGGAPVTKLGGSNELEVEASAVFPKVDNLIDLGKATRQWRDLLLGRNATIGGNLTVAGNATINGNLTFGDAATDTVSFGADIDSNIIPDDDNTYDLGSSGQQWKDIYINGVAYLDEVDIDAGAIDGTPIGANSASTGAFTTLAASGATTLSDALTVTGATALNGGLTMDTNKFTVADTTGNTAIAGTLAVTGATTMTGALTANGGVTGDLTGNVTGDLTGNVTSTGTSSLATVNVSGAFTANGNTVLGNAATDTVTFNADIASNLIPSADSTYTIGDGSNYWSHGYIDAITTTGNVAIGGDATITGNLTVQGTTTTVNSTTVDVADLNITVASGAGSSAAANGGGLTVGGANATFTYTNSDDRWNMNKALNVSTVHGNVTGNLTGNVTGNVTGNLTGDVTGDVTGTVSSIANHNTDSLSEGSSNLYHTTARVRGALSAGSGISYNSSTGVITNSATSANDATITISAGGGMTGGGNFTTNQGSAETITISHSDTSSQSSVNNSGSTFIQDITLDTYGHVTGITSASTGSGGSQTTGQIVGAGTGSGTSGDYLQATLLPNTNYLFQSQTGGNNVFIYKNNGMNDRLVNGIGNNWGYYYQNGNTQYTGVGMGCVSGGTPGNWICIKIS